MSVDRDAYRVGRGLASTSRGVGFAVVAGAYVLAGVFAWITAVLLRGHHPLTIAFVADLVATAVVFAVSMAVGNSSVYDPYWSVAPPVIAAAWIVAAGSFSARQAVVLALIVAWAVRLTGNWALTWTGLAREDWRYVRIRAQTRGSLPWWLVSLTGIQVIPTLVVFAGMLAVWPAVSAGRRPFGPLDVLAVVVTGAFVVVEAVADLQLRHFAAKAGHEAGIVNAGLWRYSRHPNYLGEIGFWWGLWIFAVAAAPSWWWTVVGPIAMVLLFAFVSVPLMDQRSLDRRPGYAEHMRQVAALVPLPRRHIS
jgi:steroid 5-alpha reductase family enzyme